MWSLSNLLLNNQLINDEIRNFLRQMTWKHKVPISMEFWFHLKKEENWPDDFEA